MLLQQEQMNLAQEASILTQEVSNPGRFSPLCLANWLFTVAKTASALARHVHSKAYETF